MTALIIVFIILLLLYLLALRGRVGFCDFSEFKGHYYAHRGLHGDGVPENSLLAFKLAKEKGYGVEFDVHIMADGTLAVMHDHSLLRTAGEDVKIEDLTAEDLKKYTLEGTNEKIPTFKEVLEVFDGKLPLIIELKATTKNVDRLCSAVVKQLESYKGAYCVESFDPRCVYWFKKHCPNITRGQLSENYFKNSKSTISFLLKLIMSLLLTNFLARPDFSAYRFSDRKHFSNMLCLKLWKMQGVGWTITKEEDIISANKEGIISIFESIEP